MGYLDVGPSTMRGWLTDPTNEESDEPEWHNPWEWGPRGAAEDAHGWDSPDWEDGVRASEGPIPRGNNLRAVAVQGTAGSETLYVGDDSGNLWEWNAGYHGGPKWMRAHLDGGEILEIQTQQGGRAYAMTDEGNVYARVTIDSDGDGDDQLCETTDPSWSTETLCWKHVGIGGGEEDGDEEDGDSDEGEGYEGELNGTDADTCNIQMDRSGARDDVFTLDTSDGDDSRRTWLYDGAYDPERGKWYESTSFDSGTSTDATMFAVDGYDDDRIVVGESGLIYETIDGGDTWFHVGYTSGDASPGNEPDETLRHVSYGNPDVAVGENGKIVERTHGSSSYSGTRSDPPDRDMRRPDGLDGNISLCPAEGDALCSRPVSLRFSKCERNCNAGGPGCTGTDCARSCKGTGCKMVCAGGGKPGGGGHAGPGGGDQEDDEGDEEDNEGDGPGKGKGKGKGIGNLKGNKRAARRSSPTTCYFSCPNGGCEIRCAGTSTCYASCAGGNCRFTETGAATGHFSCSGGGCHLKDTGAEKSTGGAKQQRNEAGFAFVADSGELSYYLHGAGDVRTTGVSGAEEIRALGPPIDFDADGTTEIPYVREDGTNAPALKLVGVKGRIETLASNVMSGPSTGRLGQADFDADGRPDIVYPNANKALAYMDGDTLPTQIVETGKNGNNAKPRAILGAVDLNGDGTEEIYWVDSSSNVKYISLASPKTIRHATWSVSIGSNNNVGGGPPRDFGGNGTHAWTIVDSSNQPSLAAGPGDSKTVLTQNPIGAKTPITAADVAGGSRAEAVFIDTQMKIRYVPTNTDTAPHASSVLKVDGSAVQADTRHGIVGSAIQQTASKDDTTFRCSAGCTGDITARTNGSCPGATPCQTGETRLCDSDDNPDNRCAPRQICRNGAWSKCKQLYSALPEVCNGLDDDCDGLTDNTGTSWEKRDDYNASNVSGDEDQEKARACFRRGTCWCPTDGSDPDHDALMYSLTEAYDTDDGQISADSKQDEFTAMVDQTSRETGCSCQE
ncbi:MAG: FG-GAP repeat domain-containing protein [Bradymonadaceae bacterium]